MSSIQHSETWRAIPGWEGVYEVSSHGRVRSIDRSITQANGVSRRQPGRILRPAKGRRGHLQVTLSRPGQPVRTVKVHHAVLSAFVGPRPSRVHGGLHIDDNPSNNRPENLYWGTHSENTQDCIRNGGFNKNRRRANRPYSPGLKTHCPSGHLLDEANTIITPKGWRRCRNCKNARMRASRLNRSQAA